MTSERMDDGALPTDPASRAAELSARVRSSFPSSQSADGAVAFQILEQLLLNLPSQVHDESQQLEILAHYVESCRITGRMDALREHRPQIERILASTADATAEARSRAVASFAGALNQRGEYDAALRWCRSIDETTLGSCSGQTAVKLLCAIVESLHRKGDAEGADSVVPRLLLTAEQSNDPGLQGTVWGLLANIAKTRGSLREANRLYLQAARLHRLGVDYVGEARDHLNRGWLLNRMGLLAEGQATFEEVQILAGRVGHSRLTLLSFLGQGLVLVRRGQLDEARRLLLRTRREAARLQMPREECLAVAYLGEAYILGNRFREATVALRTARVQAEHLAPEGDLAWECLTRVALLELVCRNLASAEAAARRSEDLSARLSLPWETARSLELLGMVLASRGAGDEAKSTFSQAEESFRDMDEQLEIQLVRMWLQWLATQTQHRGDEVDAPVVGLPYHVSQVAQTSPRAYPPPASTATSPPDLAVPLPAARDQPVEASIHARSISGHAPPDVDPIWGELGLVTRSERLLGVLREAAHLAKAGTNILILGETGTGKELVAKGIHQISELKGPYVPFNCAGCPESLIDAELFGAERGAYTGADRKREGLIVKASGGTLLLDEIGDLPTETQGALLRFLDRGEVRALGSQDIRTVSVRVLAATNRPLRRAVLERRFRADLYYRLSQGCIVLPPLRERLEDLDLLINHLWPRIALGIPLPEFLLQQDVLRVLSGHSWPGNVRELQQVLQRVRVLVEIGETLDYLRVSDLLTELTGEELLSEPGEIIRSLSSSQQIDRSRGTAVAGRKRARVVPSPDKVIQTIVACGGDRAKAMEALGISRATLYRQLRRARRESASQSD